MFPYNIEENDFLNGKAFTKAVEGFKPESFFAEMQKAQTQYFDSVEKALKAQREAAVKGTETFQKLFTL